jgi:hypothetical protein
MRTKELMKQLKLRIVKHNETLKKLTEDYGEEGKLQWTYALGQQAGYESILRLLKKKV